MPGNLDGLGVKPSPATTIEAAMKEARALAYRAQDIRDRLLGPSPRGGVLPSESPVPVPSGRLYELEDNANALQDEVTRAFDALSEIERALGIAVVPADEVSERTIDPILHKHIFGAGRIVGGDRMG